MPPKKRKNKVPRATPAQRDALSKARDAKLKKIRKGKGGGRPTKPSTTKTRDELNKMRDELLKQLRKELGTPAGRPKTAAKQMEGMYI